jgi:dipeptidyl-peptidase-4
VKVRPYRSIALIALVALFLPVAAPAAPSVPTPPGAQNLQGPTVPLAVEDLFAPEPITGRLPSSITWAPDGSRFLYTLPSGDPAQAVDTHVYDRRAHRDRIFFRAKAEGKGARPTAEFVWSPNSQSLAFLDGGDLYVIRADGTGRTKLATGADDPQWSPDSTRVAYVHANDLYAAPIAGGAAVRYSLDGTDTAVNGEPDWVYSEELGMHHAYAWSPDGKRIAYLHVDDGPVTKFPIVDFLFSDNVAKDQRYPLAGERNPIVTLRVGSAGGATQTLYSTATHDDYVANVGWTPRGLPAAKIISRAQNDWQYVAFTTNVPRVLAHEHASDFLAFPETDVASAPFWLADGSQFFYVSQQGGEDDMVSVDAASGRTTKLTQGFHVDGIIALDEKLHVAYVRAAYPTRRDETALVVPLRGGQARALASGSGTHTFVMAHDARHFVRIDSSFDVPPTYTIGSTLHDADNVLRNSQSLANRGLVKTDLFQIDSPFGKLDAWMMKPPNFDPAKKYPVITYVYGGPATPTTGNAWGGPDYLFHQLLAQHGFIVFSVDGPGSQIDRKSGVAHMYHNLGPGSLAGQLAGAAYLKTLPYVDASRLGIWGWSFGGYETTYALTHAPGVWKVGVAVAPVTDWRFYDTIYTERYMGTPQQNPRAYDESAVMPKAGALRGSLLISHGTSDDNVHMANTISLLQAFVLAGKQVDFMVYPRKTHGISGIPQRRHLFTHMLDYWEAHL